MNTRLTFLVGSSVYSTDPCEGRRRTGENVVRRKTKASASSLEQSQVVKQQRRVNLRLKVVYRRVLSREFKKGNEVRLD